MIGWLLVLAAVFVVLLAPLLWIAYAFACQIADDKFRAVERQQARLRLTAAGGAVRR